MIDLHKRKTENSPSKPNYDSSNGIGESDTHKMTTPSSSDRAADKNRATAANTRTRDTQGARVSSREKTRQEMRT
ncbi:hypothetical protein E4U60_002570 [Claviceps pazoutovae]|uniref:Uncharacterized protein n=1 Tax=Claviceps pazoutovae TaxID=1649127 RepID=A0A9P7MBF9_9HYPO|nr:hypothetical protein E4U60_002570 [Claviceps pazoutovae]